MIKPLGQYRWIAAGCPTFGENIVTTSPYFGIRAIGLVAHKKVFLQILVDSIGGLMWINVNKQDILVYEYRSVDTIPLSST